MPQNILSLIGWSIALVLLQATLFNQIHLLGYATPLPYIYVLLKLPKSTPRVVYLILAFTIGWIVDILSNTYGMTAATLCIIGLATPWALSLFTPKEKSEELFLPSLKTMGNTPFTLYALSISLLHCCVFFSIEYFTFSQPYILFLKAIGSFVLTFLLVMSFELIHLRLTKTSK